GGRRPEPRIRVAGRARRSPRRSHAPAKAGRGRARQDPLALRGARAGRDLHAAVLLTRMRSDETTRIYIAGCGGMLGEAVYGCLAPIADVRATDIAVNEPWHGHADVRDYAEMDGQIEGDD